MARLRNQRDGEEVKVKGITVPYTFWPNSYILHGRIVSSDPWLCMKGYILRNFASQREKKRRILACAFLDQARDFYQSAKLSEIGSRPLLYYYSFLNLTKAFLTVRKKNIELVKCTHGLRETRDNYDKSRLYFTSQKVRVDDKTGNNIHVYREFVTECGFQVPEKPKPAKIIDLFKQIVGIHQAYCRTFNRSLQFIPISQIYFKYNARGKKVWVTLLLNRQDLAVRKDIVKAIKENMESFEEVRSIKDNCRQFESKEVYHYGRSPKDVLDDLVEYTKKDVWSVLCPGGYKFYVSSVPKKERLAQVAAIYQIMFYFASIARYRPDDFLKLIEGKYGWIIQEFIDTQAIQFVYLLGSGLIRSEMVIPEAAIG